MAQFEVVEAIFKAGRPISKDELDRKIDLHPSSIGAGLQDCLQKGYIISTDDGYTVADGFNKEQLENIRPKTIDELRE